MSPSGRILHEFALLAISCIAYLLRNTYGKPHCAINVLNVILWAFVMNCENLEFIWLKFYKFPSIIDIINSKGNEITGGKLVRPAISCSLFWPATRERLSAPALKLENERFDRCSTQSIPLWEVKALAGVSWKHSTILRSKTWRWPFNKQGWAGPQPACCCT